MDSHDPGQESSDYGELPCAADVDGIEEICRYDDENDFATEINAGHRPPSCELGKASVMKACRTLFAHLHHQCNVPHSLGGVHRLESN